MISKCKQKAYKEVRHMYIVYKLLFFKKKISHHFPYRLIKFRPEKRDSQTVYTLENGFIYIVYCLSFKN